MKCNISTGKCFLNQWFWLDPNMDKTDNYAVLRIQDDIALTYQCENYYVAIDEQMTIMSLTTD